MTAFTCCRLALALVRGMEDKTVDILQSINTNNKVRKNLKDEDNDDQKADEAIEATAGSIPQSEIDVRAKKDHENQLLELELKEKAIKNAVDQMKALISFKGTFCSGIVVILS